MKPASGALPIPCSARANGDRGIARLPIAHLETAVILADVTQPADMPADANTPINRATVNGPGYNAATRIRVETGAF